MQVRERVKEKGGLQAWQEEGDEQNKQLGGQFLVLISIVVTNSNRRVFI